MANSDNNLNASRVVAYIVSSELIAASSQLPSNRGRSSAVHSLIHAFGLSRRVKVLRPVPASYKDLAVYHTKDYLDFVLASNTTTPSTNELHEVFGLDSDCPRFPLLPQYVSLVGGSALTAAQALISGAAQTTICWDGGRHHAQKGEAAGFCYVADCVLALMALKRAPRCSPTRKSRTMCIDLDLHFSDAVSQAFVSSNSRSTDPLQTLSIHHASPGFYPPSTFSSLPRPPPQHSIPIHSRSAHNEGSGDGRAGVGHADDAAWGRRVEDRKCSAGVGVFDKYCTGRAVGSGERYPG
ncbi:hypothetical protein H0H92_004355 [Tricholoma furcatifolium]|nr:hypothetical protein H0H92_004355 [Tricholoma furcatifolium]